jgi:hypothetical protein
MRGGATVAAALGGAQMPDGSFPVEIVEGMPVVAAPEEIARRTPSLHLVPWNECH